jgi:hypothetical protein
MAQGQRSGIDSGIMTMTLTLSIYQIAVLAPYEEGHLNCRMIYFLPVFYDVGT